MNEELRKMFEELSKPLIKFINDYYNPHTKIIIDCDSSEIVVGDASFRTEEFIPY